MSSAKTKSRNLSTIIERLVSPEITELILKYANGQSSWLVGGALRDHFLRETHPDLDFAVQAGSIGLARQVADSLGAAFFVLDHERQAARVILPGSKTLDFVGLQGASIQEDLRLRDFTINALAIDLNRPENLIDDLGGLQDLKDGRLRACSTESMLADPVRSIRGVRLAARLQFQLEPSTRSQIRAAASDLVSVSPERIRDELVKLLDPGTAATAARLMSRLGILPHVLPELAVLQTGAPERWEHSLQLATRISELLGALATSFEQEHTSNLTLAEASLRLGRFRKELGRHLEQKLRGGRTVSQILMLAALNYDLNRNAEVSSGAGLHYRLKSLRFSVNEAERARQLVRGEARIADLEADASPLSIHRYFRTMGSAGVELVLLYLGRAKVLGPTQSAWKQKIEIARLVFEAWFEQRDRIVEPTPLVRGDDLASELGIEHGPQIGELLRRISETQVSGAVSTRAEAIALGRSLVG